MGFTVTTNESISELSLNNMTNLYATFHGKIDCVKKDAIVNDSQTYLVCSMLYIYTSKSVYHSQNMELLQRMITIICTETQLGSNLYTLLYNSAKSVFTTCVDD